MFIFVHSCESIHGHRQSYSLNKHRPIIHLLFNDLQLWDHFIRTNPKIPFNRILNYQYNFVEAFSDASDIHAFEWWIIINWTVFLWSNYWFSLRASYKNMSMITHEAMMRKIIQYKELFALTYNIIAFGPLINKSFMFVLRTDNQGVETNIIKQCFKNCWISLDLYRFCF